MIVPPLSIAGQRSPIGFVKPDMHSMAFPGGSFGLRTCASVGHQNEHTVQ
jgi:hypothetical protein